MMDRRGGLESARGLKLAYIPLSMSEMCLASKRLLMSSERIDSCAGYYKIKW